MCYRWLMPLLAAVMMAQTPEEHLAHQLDHEAQFQLRFARQDVALRNLQIAEWLSPNPNRQAFLNHQTKKKGTSHDPH